MIDFINTLQDLGLSLKAEKDKLILSGSTGKLTPAQMESIRKNPSIKSFITENKEKLLQFLRQNNGGGQSVNLRKENIAALYKLSSLQEGILFHTLYEADSSVYVTQFKIDLGADLDVLSFRSAWELAMKNHSILRTAFLHEQLSSPLQCVFKEVSLPFKEIDWSRLSEEKFSTVFDQFLSEDRARGFDLKEAPLFRITLVKTPDFGYKLIWTKHHILWDGWSGQILIKEVLDAYAQYLKGGQPAQRKEDSFIDYIKYVEKVDAFAEEQFWRAYVEGFEDICLLPFAANSTERNKGVGVSRQLFLNFEESYSQQILNFCHSNHLTINTLIQGVWSFLLSKYCNKEDVLFGVTVSSRPPEPRFNDGVGLYINTLPFRAKIEARKSISKWLSYIQISQGKTRSYQYTSLKQIQDWSGLQGDFFDTIIVLRNFPIDPAVNKEDQILSIENVEVEENNNYLLSIEVAIDKEISIDFKYNGSLLEEVQVAMIKRHFEHVLGQIIQHPGRSLGDLQLITPAEKEKVWAINDASRRPRYGKATVLDLIEEQARRHPDRIAYEYKGISLSYGALERQSNQFANYLIDRGVGAETLVAVCLERTLETIVALFGILKAGGAFIPLDPAYPIGRLHYILEDSKVGYLISSEELIRQFNEKTEVDFISINDWQRRAEELKEERINASALDNTAYVIYTSGSTGRPKGVIIEHSALSNFLQSMVELLELDSRANLLAITTFSFDIAYLELFMPLVAGGRVILADSETIRDGAALQDLIREKKPSHMQATPVYWKMLLDQGWRNEEGLTILSGGEAILDSLKDQLLSLSSKPVWNLYGPTETTIWSSVKRLKRKEKVNIGKPIANTDLYVIDQQGKICANGIPGELHIAGAGLARGYLNRPFLTKERFRQLRLHDNKQTRLYSTGDLVRRLENGEIEYLSRIDNQVKIRGHRIELGEIEATLDQCPSVHQAAVIAKEDTFSGKALVAYVVPENDFDREGISTYLKQRLPDYMIPALIIEMEQLPLTPNGKLDKKSLPDPENANLLSAHYVAPSSVLEENIIEIWKAKLALERIGVQDNFFEIGGHSLLAMRVVGSIRKALQVSLKVKDIFDHPTVADLAAYIEDSAKEETKLPRTGKQARPDTIPLSVAQKRIWLIDQLGGSKEYHLPKVIRISGALDIPLLEASFRKIMERHEPLRTIVRQVAGNPSQVLLNSVAWNLVQTTKENPYQEEAVKQYVLDTLNLPFNLEEDFMLRAELISFSQQDHILIIVLHHIAADGWSIPVLIEEMAELYQSAKQNRKAVLPALSLPFSDYSLWQQAFLRGQEYKEQMAYWKAELDGMVPFKLPADFSKSTTFERKAGQAKFNLNQFLRDKLKSYSSREGVTEFVLLLSVFKALLFRHTRQKDISIGVPLANRDRKETHGLIGYFSNTVVLRNQLSGSLLFSDLWPEVKTTLLAAIDNQSVPFEHVLEHFTTSRVGDENPLFQIMFSLQNESLLDAFELGSLKIQSLESAHARPKFDLTFRIQERAKKLKVLIDYDANLFAASTIQQLFHHFERLLFAALANPDRSIDQLSMLSPLEEKKLGEDFGNLHVGYPRERNVVDLFEAQVRSHPDKMAMKLKDQSMTYRELNQSANQVSHYLQASGLEPGSFVALSMDRSFELIIAMLGVLKAGGAYVPIDPDYPQKRIDFVLKDSGIQSIITSKKHKKQFRGKTRQVCVIEELLKLEDLSKENPATPIHPRFPAYVIYTSGTTGYPKGVIIEHNNLVRLFKNEAFPFHFDEQDVWTMFHSPSFDFSVWEMYGALLFGGSLIIIPKEIARDSYTFSQILLEEGVTVLNQTPSAFYVLQEQLLQSNATVHLRYIIFGGEALHIDRLKTWHRQYPACKLINMYGITETTVHVTFKEITNKTFKDASRSNIGKPIPTLSCHILDEEGQLLPSGCPGELYIEGEGLSRGYLNRPHLSAERFKSVELHNTIRRLYRTGDLARWLPNGDLEYLGRIDDQVQIRGHRIELGEIEALIQQHDSVRQSLVLGIEEQDNSKKLAAYIVFHPSQKNTNHQLEILKSYLKASLPEYMNPAWLIPIDQMPTTKNGKVDKKALPKPDRTTLVGQPYAAPRNTIEQQLANIWQQLLDIDKVGIHDNFFELGGDSIIVIQMVNKCKHLGLHFQPKDVFQFQTIGALSTKVYAGLDRQNAEQGILTGKADLLGIQQWFFEKEYEGMAHFNQSVLLEIDKEIEAEQLARAIQHLTRHHDALRFRYHRENKNAPASWTQHYGKEEQELEIEELKAASKASLAKSIEQTCNRHQRSLDLEHGKIFKAALIKTPDAVQNNRMFLAIHHLAIDGVSWRIFTPSFGVPIKKFA